MIKMGEHLIEEMINEPLEDMDDFLRCLISHKAFSHITSLTHDVLSHRLLNPSYKIQDITKDIINE